MTVICILDVPPKMLTVQPNVAALTSRHLWSYESPHECSFLGRTPPTEPGGGDTPRRSGRGQGGARATASWQRDSDSAQVIQDALPSTFGADPQTNTSAQQNHRLRLFLFPPAKSAAVREGSTLSANPKANIRSRQIPADRAAARADGITVLTGRWRRRWAVGG